MPADLKEEVTDICWTSVEKHSSDYEKCTQVGLLGSKKALRALRCGSYFRALRANQLCADH